MWYTGNIVDAIKLAKEKNIIFVVYVEGKDDASKKFASFINDTKIRSKLESDKFVAILIEGGSESYMQFAKIYQIVPLPSLFFIGKNGTPLEIGTCAIDSVETMEKMIERALNSFSASLEPTKKPSESLATVSKYSGKLPEDPQSSAKTLEKLASNSSKKQNDDALLNFAPKMVNESEESTKATNEGKTATAKPLNAESGLTSGNSSAVTAAELAARVEETRKVLELKRRERIEEEKRLEKERENSRGKSGKDVINVQQWQKEQELKELKHNILRERREEQEARQRILKKIASDRAERAQKFARDSLSHSVGMKDTKENDFNSTIKSVTNSEMTRLHFRLSNGSSGTHTFDKNDTFDVVRTFVKISLLQGTGIGDFTLATAYPKREFAPVDDTKTLEEYGLCPSAVILVITKQNKGPVDVVAHSERIKNIFNFVFWSLVSPVLVLFNYLKNSIMGDENAKGAQKRASDEQINPDNSRKKSSLDRMYTGPSTSKNSESNRNSDQSSGSYNRYVAGRSSNIHRLSDNHDTDDENATWNGNSTQQQ